MKVMQIRARKSMHGHNFFGFFKNCMYKHTVEQVIHFSHKNCNMNIAFKTVVFLVSQCLRSASHKRQRTLLQCPGDPQGTAINMVLMFRFSISSNN